MAVTPLLQITQVATNQTSKEATINDGFVRLERALNDISTVSLSAGNATLVMADYTVPFLFKCTGHTVARDLTVPASKRIFGVYNGGTGNVTVKISGGTGDNAVVPPGSFCVLFNDSVDMYTISDSAASGQVTSLLDLPEVPDSFAGHAGEALVINATEDGLEFGTIAVGLVDLDDGPGTLAGSAGKLVKINSGATGFEFGFQQFNQLTDAPASYTGMASKMVVVKASEDGVEFIDQPETFVLEDRPFTLTNAGFELNNTTSWSVGSGTWLTSGAWGSVTPSEGSYLAYYNYGQGTTATKLYRSIDLTTLATGAELDDDCFIDVIISMASDNGDVGYIVIEYYDASAVLLDSDESSHWTGTGTMIDRNFRTTLPIGTRSVTLHFHATHTGSLSLVDPSSLAFAFDNLRVSLKLPQEQVVNFNNLLDVPNSYTGHANKLVSVKADESGLEFITKISTFLALTDTPNDFTDDGGKAVRVNAAANALEFVENKFTELDDAPASLLTNAGKFVKVNTAETALEFSDPINVAEISFFIRGTIANNEIVFSYIPTKDLTFPINLAGSKAVSDVAATGSTVFNVKKNGTNVGTLTWAASGTTATLAMASATTFTALTDKLTIVAPASMDATLSSITGTLFADVV